MKTRVFLLVVMVAGFAARFSQSAQTQPPAALTGHITSAEEGAMEGVLVSAKLAGSVTVTVVSDAEGRYSFPASKLQAGHQVISIRAVGYDLVKSPDVIVAPGRTVTADLQLTKARDIAS